jgi:amino acid permease
MWHSRQRDPTQQIRYEGFSSPEDVYSTAGSSCVGLVLNSSRGQKQILQQKHVTWTRPPPCARLAAQIMSNEAVHDEREPLLNGSPFQSSNEPVPVVASTGLVRGLSARQVQTIAIGGTIGTGLFLGTGRSLAIGGPGTMLVCYGVTGFIVYVTLLLLGEMATQYPVAGMWPIF